MQVTRITSSSFNQEDIKCKLIHPVISEAPDVLCEGTESSLNRILLTLFC